MSNQSLTANLYNYRIDLFGKGKNCYEKERRASSPQLPKIVLDLISLTKNRGCFLICKYSWCLKITQALLSYDISFHGDVMTITTYRLRFPWLMRFFFKSECTSQNMSLEEMLMSVGIWKAMVSPVPVNRDVIPSWVSQKLGFCLWTLFCTVQYAHKHLSFQGSKFTLFTQPQFYSFVFFLVLMQHLVTVNLHDMNRVTILEICLCMFHELT